MMISRPQPDEYGSFYQGYIDHVDYHVDLFKLMESQYYVLMALVNIDTNLEVVERTAETPHQPGEWSIKQVLGHINDTERIFGYRALRIARGDTTPLAGFDQDSYVAATDFNARTCESLLTEFLALRNANLICFRALTEEEIDRRGVASDNPVSVRALLYMLAGHVTHHIKSIKANYNR